MKKFSLVLLALFLVASVSEAAGIGRGRAFVPRRAPLVQLNLGRARDRVVVQQVPVVQQVVRQRVVVQRQFVQRQFAAHHVARAFAVPSYSFSPSFAPAYGYGVARAFAPAYAPCGVQAAPAYSYGGCGVGGVGGVSGAAMLPAPAAAPAAAPIVASEEETTHPDGSKTVRRVFK